MALTGSVNSWLQLALAQARMTRVSGLQVRGLTGVIELEVIDLGPHRIGFEGVDPDVVDLSGRWSHPGVEPVRGQQQFSGMAAWPLWAAALKLSIRCCKPSGIRSTLTRGLGR